jgi:phosphopentomutase
LVAYSPGLAGKTAPDRGSFADVGAAILEGFGVAAPATLPKAHSFLTDWKAN